MAAGRRRSEHLWLIVPVKPLAEVKSRLASVLSPAERAALMRKLLVGVLQAASASALFAGILVISRDRELLSLAARHGAFPIEEHGADLNSALEEARSALPADAAAVLVLPADLPEISAQGLQAFMQEADLDAGGALVAIAPSVTGGTNALLLAPPAAISFAFGPHDGVESADRHARLAIESGARLVTIKSKSLAFDVDLPGDYLLLQQNSQAADHQQQPVRNPRS